ncbi:MAG: M16 family metallopeptidase [Gemmatimonadales bacterium]
MTLQRFGGRVNVNVLLLTHVCHVCAGRQSFWGEVAQTERREGKQVGRMGRELMKRRSIWTIWCAVLFVGAATVEAQSPVLDPSDPLPPDPLVTVGKLDNGLRYYVRVNHRPENRAELRLVVNVGSVLEDDDQLGLAHFVEHMAFNGTKRFPRQQLVDYLERIGMRFGADLNAYTSFDETVYMLQVPTDTAEIMEKAFEILEDWAHNQLFDSTQIDAERGVVMEEWRLGRGAGARIRDKQFPTLFRNSRYAERLPIGKPAVLESFEHSALRRFYREWYRPDLMAVVAVGDFDGDSVVAAIRDHFSGWSGPTDGRERTVYPVPDHERTLVTIATDKEATSSSVSLYYLQPPQRESTVGDYRELIVERLYNSMLNDRLFELTQQSDPPFLYGSSGQGRLIRSKEVYVLGAGVADGGVERGLRSLLTEAERVARYGFTATELERHKTELLRRLEREYAEREKTNSAEYAFESVNAFLYDEPIPGIALEYQLHQRFLPGIQLDEVNSLARQWLTDHNRVILVSAPEKDGVEIPTADELLQVFRTVAASDIEPYTDAVDNDPLIAVPPTPGTIVEGNEVAEIGVTIWRLSNGARVILKPTDFKDDEIVFRASSPGGTSLAPDPDFIAASTAATVVSAGGVGRFSLVELQKKLAGKAVSLSPSLGSLYEGMSGSASPQDLETLFQLIYMMFTAPRRDSTSYLAFRSQVKSVLANRSSSPEAAFQDTLSVTLAQHHFRARPPTNEVYDEMDLDKSFRFYQDRFADAGDFTFAFVGNLDVAETKPFVLQYLASLPSNGRTESWRDLGIEPPAGKIEKVVRRGVEPRSRTSVIFTGPTEFTRQNRYRIRSLSEVLQTRLREKLREALSGTYSVSVSGSVVSEPRPSYSMSISFSADPDRLEELTAAVFEEIRKLRDQGPDPSDVAKVQEQERREMETSLKQNRFWLGQLLAYDRNNLDPREILSYGILIDGLTVSEIRSAARRYLPLGNYVRVSLYPEDKAGSR